MCGIFGILVSNNNKYTSSNIKTALLSIASLSESRGKDSSGMCFRNDFRREFSVIKSTKSIKGLINDTDFKKYLNKELDFFSNGQSSNFISFGHSRLVTNGSQLSDVNNQPVVKDEIIAIHNGIIVNVEELWTEHDNLNRKYEIDTEVLLSIIRDNITKGQSVIQATEEALKMIKGTVATALFFADRNEAVLSTNNGSLYYATNSKDFLVFASEAFILKKMLKDSNIEASTGDLMIKQLKPETGLYINLDSINFNTYSTATSQKIDNTKIELNSNYSTSLVSIEGKNNSKSIIVDVEQFHLETDNSRKRKLLEYNIDKIKHLKRCTKCLLPETFPFIDFNEKGECNYCKNYIKRNQPKPLSVLKDLIEPYRKTNGQPDCLIPFSGGRDSTYVLHFVKEELGLNPIAYTYDWGMVTDLGRRNIARVCGKLGVENIIVAADINMKRRNIRLNIEAWLKNPQLGMIPLFMAGDKQFFKYANLIKKQANIDLNIWGINFLENTDFKVGFCGVPPDWHKEMIYSMNAKRQAKLFSYVAKNFVKNPSYINNSLVDTFDSFLSRYTNPKKDYYHFFDFYEWDEQEIDGVLINEYDWETAKDLKSTWRIGDGTASFYNYVYYTIAGFSEFDTFRSNQIREGMITREEGLKYVNEENKPRYESLRWYLEILDLDYERVINIVNSVPKLY